MPLCRLVTQRLSPSSRGSFYRFFDPTSAPPRKDPQQRFTPPPQEDIPMSQHKLLSQFDQDGALDEMHHEAVESLDEGDNRRSFLKKAGLSGAAVMGSGALLSALTPA